VKLGVDMNIAVLTACPAGNAYLLTEGTPRIPTTATITVTVSEPGETSAVRVLKTRTAKTPKITAR
jgi:hypothetical protein